MRYVHKFYQFIGSQDRTKDSFISPNIIFWTHGQYFRRFFGDLFEDKTFISPRQFEQQVDFFK